MDDRGLPAQVDGLPTGLVHQIVQRDRVVQLDQADGLTGFQSAGFEVGGKDDQVDRGRNDRTGDNLRSSRVRLVSAELPNRLDVDDHDGVRRRRQAAQKRSQVVI